MFDKATVDRVRRILTGNGRITEKKMFGGLVFMLNGNMCCGVHRTGALMVRVGAQAHKAALAEPHIRPMIMGKKEVSGFIFADPLAIDADEDLEKWLRRGIAFSSTLPPK
jgi:TfoX/Sxy family transcriptional regulator of competence genes